MMVKIPNNSQCVLNPLKYLRGKLSKQGKPHCLSLPSQVMES